MSDNDKQLEELHPDQQLRRDIEAGRITQEQVDEIWKATADLSPQTPITVRRAVLLMRHVSKDLSPMDAMAANWPLFCQQVMTACTEMQAALMRDESKFSHLVAGTETIVKEMQQVGTLARRFDQLNDRLDAVDATLRRNRARPHSLIRWQRKKKGGDANDLQLSAVSSKRKIAATPLSVASGSGDDGGPFRQFFEPIPDPDHAANEARAFTLGSAWEKTSDQGTIYTWKCPWLTLKLDDPHGPSWYDCDYIYRSGVTDPDVTANFRCLEHNVALVRCKD